MPRRARRPEYIQNILKVLKQKARLGAVDALDEVREELVDLWGSLAPFWGVTPTAGRVLALLWSRAEPQDGAALARDLGASRGAVSMAARELADWGLVQVERPPGTRRVHFRPVTDLERVIRSIVTTRKRREWDPILESVGRWRGRLSRSSGADAGALHERLADIEGVVGLVDAMANRFLEGGTLQRLGFAALVRSARRKARKST